MLQLTHIKVQLGQHIALNDVNVELKSGCILGILGANGAGKTTLLHTMAGDIPSQQGNIRLEGVPLSSFSPQELARHRAVLPQHAPLDFSLSVEEVVLMGLYPWPQISPAQAQLLLEYCLQQADSLHLRKRRFPSLSGGEATRCHFARVLIQLLASKTQGPQYLFLDEPCANLDPMHQQLILSSTRRLVSEKPVAAAITIHDVNLATRWCDELLLLLQGEIIACGKPAQVVTPENLSKIYGIEPLCIPHPQVPEWPLVIF